MKCHIMKHFIWVITVCQSTHLDHFGPRSGQTKGWAWSGSNLFDTQMVFLKEFFEKVDFEKNQQTTTKHEKFPRGQRFKGTSIPGGLWDKYLNIKSWPTRFLYFLHRWAVNTKQNAVPPVRLEPATPRSQVKHSTTEPPPSSITSMV